MENKIGLNLDYHPSNANKGEWKDARNIVVSKKYNDVSNENGAVKFGTSDNVGYVNGIIVVDDGYIEFVTNDTICRIIYVLDTGVSTVIINDPALGFKKTNAIRGVYQRNYAGHLIISWWEGIDSTANSPRILDIDCLPFTLDGNKAFINPADVEMLRLFAPVNNIIIDLEEVLDTGGDIETGVYYIATAYEFPDKSRTAFFNMSNSISVHDNHSKDLFSKIDGAASGVGSNKSIKIKFSNIDTRYYKLVIGIVKKIGGVISAIHAASIKIDGSTLTWVYTGTQLLTDLDISEIIVPYQTYSKVQSGAVNSGRLYLYNIETDAAPQIQQYINNIKLKWNADKVLNISSYDDSFKKPTNIFYFRNFRTFAVYSFYLIVHMDNGQKWTFPIPGRTVGTINIAGAGDVNENDTISDIVTAGATDTDVLEANNNYGDKKYFQIFNTALADGTLGFWENQDETYEVISCNDIYDCSGVKIGALTGKVRHHRIPNIKLLNSVYGDIINTPVTSALFFNLNMGTSKFVRTNSGLTAKVGKVIWKVGADNTSGWGTFTVSPAGSSDEFVFSKPAYVKIKAYFKATNVDAFIDAFAAFIDQSASYTFTEIINENYDAGLLGGNKTFSTIEVDISFYANVGDKLVWEFRFTNGFVLEDVPSLHTDSYFEVYMNDPSFAPANIRMVGIEVTNLCLPTNLQDRIVGYELAYAERTPNNQTVFDQDAIKYFSTGLFRSHPFDSLLNKTSAKIDFLQSYYKYKGEIPQVYLTRAIFEELREVNESQYLPTDVTIPYDNKLREEVLYGRVNSGFSGIIAAIEPPDLYYADAYLLVDFIRIIDNAYIDRFQQKIVRTGFVYDYATISGAAFPIYGGDNFVNIYGVVISPSLANEVDIDHQIYRLKNLRQLMYPVESIANIGLRHSDVLNFYFPRNTGYDNTISIDPNVAPIIGQTTNGMLYNKDYSSVNNIELQVIRECISGCADLDIIKFPTRIHRSINAGLEEYSPGWRTFLTNSYFEMPKNRGVGWALNSSDDRLYIQNELALFIADGRDILLGNSIEVQVGRGDLFTSEPNEVVPIDGGYIGCRSLWAAIMTPVGYLVVDASTSNRGKIFLVNGSTPTEISANKTRWFFRKNLYVGTTDNPFNLSGITATYDDENRRLIIGKHLLVVNNAGNRLLGFDNITMSFSLDYQRWICFHDYTPNILFFTRENLYSVFNNVNGQVYKHNIPGVFGYYYHTAAPALPMYVDYIINNLQKISEKIKSILFVTRNTDSNGKVQYDRTITDIAVYTDDQCTGLVPITPQTTLASKSSDIRNNEYRWSFNKVRDNVIDRNVLSVNADGSFVTANLNINKPFFKKSQIVGIFIIVRMQYNNTVQEAIEITTVEAVKIKSVR